jgi:hypothetical protein
MRVPFSLRLALNLRFLLSYEYWGWGELDMVFHACNPSTQEVEAGES